MTRWDTPELRTRVTALDIWRRFPKFILGLVGASLLATLASESLSFTDFETVVRPAFIAPLTNLRVWVFNLSFLSIGLTTRWAGFTPSSGNAFIAFATGVLVNVVLGFLLSAWVFQTYWTHLQR